MVEPNCEMCEWWPCHCDRNDYDTDEEGERVMHW
jgi:hypothetical protein